MVEPGQFSIRGGIVDVFSFSNDHPYRIEFFGDEVESIRSFDPVSQRSVQVLNKIFLLPNMQERMMLEERESILQYLPKGTLIWAEEAQSIEERINLEYTKAVAAFEKLQTDESISAPGKLFAKGGQLIDLLRERTTIEFGRTAVLGAATEIAFHTIPQPSFNKNFDLLLENLRKHKEEGKTTFVFSESSKQLERIETILRDLQHKIPEEEQADFVPVYHSLHGGFADEQQNIACYTDHQIFERYHRFRLRESFASKEAITIK